MSNSIRLRPLVLLFVAALVVEAVHAGQTPAGASLTLATIQVTGLKRYTAADVQTLSQLTIGQTVTTADLGPAANRLAGTGLFKTVRYRYATTATAIDVTFEVEEESWTTPVVFDNFVWLTDEELTKAVRRAVPTFDGTAPENENANKLISDALQQTLDGRKIQGQVMFSPHLDLKTKRRQNVSAITGVGDALKICTVNLPGVSDTVANDLRSVLQPLIGMDYSRSYLAGVMEGSLPRVYRRRGFWKAAFGPERAQSDARDCKGITVTVPVNEGPQYTWDRAEWIGASGLVVKDLDAALGMKPGDEASESKIEAGLIAVHLAYAKQGYVTQQATFTPVLDEAVRRAKFDIAVTEGPQFRMGTLAFDGFPPAEVERLTKSWKLKPGDIYNAAYLTEFATTVIRLPAARPDGPAAPRITPESRTDVANRVVNVRFVMK